MIKGGINRLLNCYTAERLVARLFEGAGGAMQTLRKALRQRPPTFLSLFAALCKFDKTRLD